MVLGIMFMFGVVRLGWVGLNCQGVVCVIVVLLRILWLLDVVSMVVFICLVLLISVLSMVWFCSLLCCVCVGQWKDMLCSWFQNCFFVGNSGLLVGSVQCVGSVIFVVSLICGFGFSVIVFLQVICVIVLSMCCWCFRVDVVFVLMWMIYCLVCGCVIRWFIWVFWMGVRFVNLLYGLLWLMLVVCIGMYIVMVIVFSVIVFVICVCIVFVFCLCLLL